MGMAAINAKGSKVMPKFNVRALQCRVFTRLRGVTVSAGVMIIPWAFQDLKAATIGNTMAAEHTQLAQASEQPGSSQATPPPEPQPATPPSAPIPSPSAPVAAPSPMDEKDKEKQGTPATVVDGQQLESILGKNVLSPTGEDMGRIVDVMVDRTGQARAVIIDFGGFLGVGTRKIAVDWRMIRFPPDGKMANVIMDLSRNQLRVAPIFKPGEPVVMLGRSDAPTAVGSPREDPPALAK
jgi:sporulation protein YlmC with PRC-barrel domain